MNSLFYLAVDRLPLSTVGAIEFLGVVILAAAGARTRRNLLRVAAGNRRGVPADRTAVAGPAAGFRLRLRQLRRLHAVRGARPPCRQHQGRRQCDRDVCRIVERHRPTGRGHARGGRRGNTVRDRRRSAGSSRTRVGSPWGIGVGLCSSVIPYVTDQLAMARLRRATFALMLALLPATATVVGLVVLFAGAEPARPRRHRARHRGGRLAPRTASRRSKRRSKGETNAVHPAGLLGTEGVPDLPWA